jgi:hypothetical protein
VSKRDEAELAALPEPQGLVMAKRPGRQRYHSEECLLDLRGTKFAIAKFLPAVPDVIGPAPFGEPGDPPMKYWLRRRVSLIQFTNKDYQAWRSRADQARDRKREEAQREERKRWARERGLPKEWYDAD